MEMWTREAMERWFLCFILVLHPLASVFANMEADALHCLRTNLNDPKNVLQSWDPTLVNPCTWLHVTCNSENSVIRVDLGNAQLSGQLVPQLGQLKNLEYLELYRNTISGIIPTELGDLANLVSLDLYLNNFTGNIPDSLGKLTQLRFLRLNNNSLSGQIPVSLTNISTLQILDLSNNNLSGRVPSNGSFSRFTPISFENNPLLCGLGTTKACPGGPPLPPSPPLILPTPPSSPVSAMKVDRSKSGDALKSENRLAAKAPEKQKKGSRKTKDPNKPKRPPTAFFVFMEQFRKEFKEKNPNNKLVSVVGKAGGAKWKSMSDSEKAPYVAKADKLKDEYLKKRSYNGLDGDKKSAADDESSDKSKSEVSELAGSDEEEDD